MIENQQQQQKKKEKRKRNHPYAFRIVGSNPFQGLVYIVHLVRSIDLLVNL
jgi:predicted amidophosphoribosyltransferase